MLDPFLGSGSTLAAAELSDRVLLRNWKSIQDTRT